MQTTVHQIILRNFLFLNSYCKSRFLSHLKIFFLIQRENWLEGFKSIVLGWNLHLTCVSCWSLVKPFYELVQSHFNPVLSFWQFEREIYVRDPLKPFQGASRGVVDKTSLWNLKLTSLGLKLSEQNCRLQTVARASLKGKSTFYLGLMNGTYIEPFQILSTWSSMRQK